MGYGGIERYTQISGQPSITTLTALVLGLLVQRASSYFDTANATIVQGGANIIISGGPGSR